MRGSLDPHQCAPPGPARPALTPVGLARGERVLRVLHKVALLAVLAEDHELELGSALQPKRLLILLRHSQVERE